MNIHHPNAPADLKSITRFFWLFIIIHTLLWTLGPTLARDSLPHDALEGIAWGAQWQLGYYKHPFLTAWLCAGITHLFATVGWPVYLLAQLAVSLTFIAVWQLAKKMLPPFHALIAALVLDGVLFYNLNSFNITPDTLQSPLWALLALFFYQALTTEKLRYWLITGLLAALCVCTKYQIIILLFPMFLFCLFHPVARQCFSNKGIYFALLTLLICISPHLIWLYQNQFITITYAEQVASEYTQNKTALNHLSYPLKFIMNGLINLIGLFIVCWPFYKAERIKHTLGSFNWQFLISVGLGPFALSVLLCAITGDYFPPRWATPYFFALGIMVIAYLKPNITRKKMRQFLISLTLLSLLLFSLRLITLTVIPRPASDAFLPNKNIAASLVALWHEHYHSPLTYIAGSNYLVSLVTPYIAEHPKPYFNWSATQSPWINEQELKAKGAIFVWDISGNYAWDKESKKNATLPQAIVDKYPELEQTCELTFYRSSDNQPITIGVALLPPAKP